MIDLAYYYILSSNSLSLTQIAYKHILCLFKQYIHRMKLIKIEDNKTLYLIYIAIIGKTWKTVIDKASFTNEVRNCNSTLFTMLYINHHILKI